MKRIFTTGLALMLTSMSFTSVHSQDALPTTAGELFHRSQYELVAPIFQYCMTKMPNTRDTLSKMDLQFKEKIAAAVKPIAIKYPEEWNAPVTAEEAEKTLAVLNMMSSQTLPQIEKTGAEVYCPTFIARLESTSVEDLSKKIMPSFEKYNENRSKLGVNFPSK